MRLQIDDFKSTISQHETTISQHETKLKDLEAMFEIRQGCRRIEDYILRKVLKAPGQFSSMGAFVHSASTLIPAGDPATLPAHKREAYDDKAKKAEELMNSAPRFIHG